MNNELELKLLQNKKYFDEMFLHVDRKIKLDEEQREAVLMDEKNLLVIAGAGSGKTTTMVAKVNYLIDKCGYKEEEIVVISFTKKVKEELIRLIHRKFKKTKVKIETFHSLGLNIINGKRKTYKRVIEEEEQYKIFSNYIKNELFKDKEKFNKLLIAFNKYLFFDKAVINHEDFNKYHDYAYGKRINEYKNMKEYNEAEIVKRRKYYKTINGEYLKSKEEVDIANCLFINNIAYEYEKLFSAPFKYNPDFYIKQNNKENYIEHFGIDEDEYNNMFNTKENERYRKIKTKKEKLFEKYPGLFITTYSKYLEEMTYIDELERQLKEKGYIIERKQEEEIYQRLKQTNEERYISTFIGKILLPFINTFKNQRKTEEDFDLLIKEHNDLKEELKVLKDFYIFYQNKLQEENTIDFADMINKAYYMMQQRKVTEETLEVDYKYLIIDEYQDISKQRFDMVRKLSELYDAKVMAVGDDWQTIFGYSGSSIELFKNFEMELENSTTTKIEHTYRNSQELIDTAGEFILQNEEQEEKHLYSDKHLKYPIEIIYFEDKEKSSIDYNRSIAVSKIIEDISKKEKRSKILLLGRYNNDVYKIKNDELFRINKEKVVYLKNRDIEIDFLTIHKAKGLGYDYCILLDLKDDRYGFPSKITDEKIIGILKQKTEEQIAYPEERRLFYVALTRTKNKIYLLAPKSKASEFAKEISKYKNVRNNNLKSIKY